MTRAAATDAVAWMRVLAAFVLVAGMAGAQPFLVVVPRPLRPALAPLVEARAKQGFAVEVLELDDQEPLAAGALRAEIHARIARAQTPGYLLLAGDSQRGGAPVPSLPRPGLPAILPRMPGKPQVWSDLGYVDTDDDGIAEWALGRIPARNAPELSAIAGKILAYERLEPGPWTRQLALVAGDGNFGLVADTVLAGAMRRLFAEELAPAFALDPLLAQPDSPFFAAPERFSDEVLARLDAGPFACVYAGHGALDRFADLRLRGRRGSWPILRQQDVARLRHAERTILLAWACHIGEFPREALGETLLRAEHGPVAVVAASEVSFPFGDLLLGRELMRAQDQPGVRRLGDLVRVARQRLMRADAKEAFVRSAATTAGLLGLDAQEQDALRRYTSDLYHLLGDPALALPVRLPLAIEVEGKPSRGRPLALRVRAGAGAPTEVELELCRDRGIAKDDVLLRTTLPLHDGAGRTEIVWPTAMPAGHAMVRASGRADKSYWSGGVRFWVRP